MVSFPYYSHTTPIRIPKDMGIVWETYHKGVPLLGVPENTLERVWLGNVGSYHSFIHRNVSGRLEAPSLLLRVAMTFSENLAMTFRILVHWSFLS